MPDVEEDDGVAASSLGAPGRPAPRRRGPRHRAPRRARGPPRPAPARGTPASPSSTKMSEMLRPRRGSIAASVSWKGTPSRSASARPDGGLARPGRPDDDRDARVVAAVTTCASVGDGGEVAVVVAGGLGDASRRRTSPGRPAAAPAPPSPRRRRRRPGRRTRRTAGGWRGRLVGRRCRRSRARGARCEIGFIAARTRSTSPIDMPPSVPPARPVRRRMTPSASRSISSWACEPAGARCGSRRRPRRP